MQRIILVAVSLGASVALSAGAPLCYPLAPGDRSVVPANAPAFVGPAGYSLMPAKMTLETPMDGGVRELERLDGGAPQFNIVLYAPGPIARGDLITLQSSEQTCGSATPARAEVSVLDVAPFPGELGEISFGEPVGFQALKERHFDGTPDVTAPSVRRDVLAVLPADVLPWLSVMRVTVNGSQPNYGHLARLVTQGSPTVIGSVVAECNQSHDKLTKPVELALEIAGRSTIPRTEATVEMDCKFAPPPQGCSSVPGTALGLLALWLGRRRVRA